MSAELTVTQIKSGIGAKPKTRGTLRALGLGRIGKTNTLPDRPEVRGMIARVPHLVRVEDGGESRGQGASVKGEDSARSEAAPAASKTESREDG